MGELQFYKNKKYLSLTPEQQKAYRKKVALNQQIERDLERFDAERALMKEIMSAVPIVRVYPVNMVERTRRKANGQ